VIYVSNPDDTCHKQHQQQQSSQTVAAPFTIGLLRSRRLGWLLLSPIHDDQQRDQQPPVVVTVAVMHLRPPLEAKQAHVRCDNRDDKRQKHCSDKDPRTDAIFQSTVAIPSFMAA
jgi:hypothetical protein